MTNIFEDAEVISCYTVEDAEKDGVLVAATGEVQQAAEELFGTKLRYYLSSGVWNLIETAVANKRWANDLAGVSRDVFYMARLAVFRNENSDRAIFQVIITGCGRRRNHFMQAVLQPLSPFSDQFCMVISLLNDE